MRTAQIMAPLIESEKKEHDDDPLAQDKNSTVTELKSRVKTESYPS